MTKARDLFLEAIEKPEDLREAWLQEQCGNNAELLAEVRSLLNYHNLSDDPLDKSLDKALGDVPTQLGSSEPLHEDQLHSLAEIADVDSDEFLAKLLEVGVMSASEIEGLNKAVASGLSSSDPHELANSLVADGKLTHFQASALLRGQPNLLVDKYLILDILDSGGMGVVFKAVHRPMNRVVAIKMLPQNLVNSQDKINRFRREVRVAATLSHPNIVVSHDADESKGIHFLVMEYVSGEDLRTHVRNQGPMSVGDAVHVILQTASALKYAHQKNVVHRDIKPRNIMLTKTGEIKVLDMGLARFEVAEFQEDQSVDTDLVDSATYGDISLDNPNLTQAGAVLGTVSFMAPEQAVDAKSVDARTDIYSLGCTFYYLLIGQAPFKGKTTLETIALHREADIPSLTNQRSDIPRPLEMIIHKMLAKQPHERFQTMQELIEALEACELPDDQQAKVRPRPLARQTRERNVSETIAASQVEAKPVRRNSWTTWAVLLLILIGGSYGMALLMGPWANRNGPKEAVDSPQVAGDNSLSKGRKDQEETVRFALRFDGLDDRVELPNLGLDPASPATIEAWCVVSAHDHKVRHHIASLDGWLDLESSQSVGHRLVGNAAAQDFILATCDRESRVIGEVVHLAGVYNGRTLSVFVNGQPVTTKITRMWAKDGNRDEWRFENLATPVPAPTFARIDKSGFGSVSNAQPSFVGQLHAVRFSNTARYSTAFEPPTNLAADQHTLALYQFDEGQGDVLKDSSGNGHHGKIVGAKWVRLDGEPLTEPSVADLLATGEWEWRVTERLDLPIDASEKIFGADMTADGLELVIHLGSRGGSYGKWDLWSMTRESLTSDWSLPRNLGPSVNSEGLESKPRISPDGLTLVFRAEETIDGTQARIATRSSRNAAWSKPSLPESMGYPKSFYGFDVTESDCWFAAFSFTGGATGLDILVSSRNSPDKPWPSATRVGPTISSTVTETDPTISDDGLLLIFHRPRNSEKDWPRDVYMSWRQRIDDPWNEPIRIDAIKSMLGDSARLLPDQRSILFCTEADDDAGVQSGVYISRLVHKGAPVEPIKGLEEDEQAAADWMGTTEWTLADIEQLPFKVHGGGDVTDDRLTVVFQKFGRKPGLWTSSRPAVGDAWAETQQLLGIEDEVGVHPSLSPNGLKLAYYENESGRTVLTKRSSPSGPWSEPIPSELSNYYTSDLHENQKFAAVVSRETVFVLQKTADSKWSRQRFEWEHRAMTGHNSATISDDGTRLVFTAEVPGVEGSTPRLCISTRDDADSEWSRPSPIEIPRTKASSHPRLFDGGDWLIFMSDGDDKGALYLARLVRKDAPVEPIKGLEEEKQAAVDLLAAFDLKRDVSHNAGAESDWKIQYDGQSIRADRKGEISRLNLVLARDVGLAYRLDLEITRRPGTSGGIVLPLRDRSVELGLGISEPPRQKEFALGLSDGSLFDAKESPFTADKRHRIEATVVHDGDTVSIQVSHDGQQMVDYHGPIDRISLWNRLQEFDGTHQLIWTGVASIEIHSAKLTNLSAADLLATGEWEWSEPENLGPVINSEGMEFDAELSDDGLTIVLVRGEDGGGHGLQDLWMSTRNSTEEEWPEPRNLGPEISSEIGDFFPQLSASGNELTYFRQGVTYKTTRASRTDDWSVPEVLHQGDERCFAISRDGLFATYSIGLRDLYFVQRDSREDQWSEPVPFGPEINSDLFESQGELSNDLRTFVFARYDGERHNSGDLWITTRKTPTDNWATPEKLEFCLPEFHEGSHRLSADGRRLTFSAVRPEGQGFGRGDIYVSRLVRKDAATEPETNEAAQAPVESSKSESETSRNSDAQKSKSSDSNRPTTPSLPEQMIDE